MRLKKDREQVEAEMDMTPMIDCVFQLIIFFMILTDMSQKDLEVLYLPKVEVADPDKPNPKEQRPVINMLSNGEIWVKGVKYYDPANPDEYRELKSYLAKSTSFMPKVPLDDTRPAGPGNPLLPDWPLLIRADQACPAFHVQKVMEQCGAEGIKIWKVELAAAEVDAENPTPQRQQ